MEDANEPQFHPIRQILPDLLMTQLLAADVYATFVKWAEGEEEALWQEMLSTELSNVRFVGMLAEEEALPPLELPPVKIEAFRELCRNAREYATQSAFERTLWALRVEHAEIDFGLERLAANVVSHAPETPVYPGRLHEQYHRLLEWSQRYKGAREIAIQVARIEEHLPRMSDSGIQQNP